MSTNTTPDATATPRTDALIFAPNSNFFSASTADYRELCRTLERELTAAKAEIIRLYADRSAANVGIDAIAGERDQLKFRAERAEAALRERTQWQCKCGGTDCAGMAENERLRAEVKRLKAADSFSKRELARGNEIIDGLRQERDQLRARVADLENDLEKSKHDADDWHRAWETVTEQAKKEVAELEQALAASATKAAAEYGEQLKPLFAKVRELEADKARLDWLEAHNNWLLCAETESPTFSCGSNENFQNWALKVATVRAAIDAARKGTP